MLAATIPAKSGQSVLELGCGVGTALFCLAMRVPELSLAAVEVQPTYAALARENAHANDIVADIREGDLATLPDDFRLRLFDHVIANPPYFDRTASSPAANEGREVAMGEGTALSVWVDVAARRLAPKGYATFIHRAERLPELLMHVGKKLGSIEILPLQARAGRDAGLVVLRARKGGRADFRLCAPVMMHEGARHETDGESYTPEIRSVLRDGAALAFGSNKK